MRLSESTVEKHLVKALRLLMSEMKAADEPAPQLSKVKP